MMEKFGNPQNQVNVVDQVLQENQGDAEFQNPSEQAYRRISDLFNAGKWEEAQEKLHFVTLFYPEHALRAKKALGQIRLDQLLSSKVQGSKKQYTVQRGDSYRKIAAQHQMNLSHLYYINGILNEKRLRPGDLLWVESLDLKLMIRFKEKTCELWQNEGKDFLAIYPLESVSKIKSKKAFLSSRVKSLLAYRKTAPILPTHPQFRFLPKSIFFTHGELELRASERPSPAEFYGATLSRTHLDELSMLLRAGTPVEIFF